MPLLKGTQRLTLQIGSHERRLGRASLPSGTDSDLTEGVPAEHTSAQVRVFSLRSDSVVPVSESYQAPGRLLG
ncbi:hypothetical protein LshimejAT787_1000320 [Lyophyllum shimeji]|uniref:Uncharacterized protein n=1 Tax=Lyophyllum shimeji TaxID=47721 RepID=A0A9P3PU87_LYOSH|nr:hypothetical protein LshimejAT787_1000320 [Lyophyllum shimeji]